MFVSQSNRKFCFRVKIGVDALGKGEYHHFKGKELFNLMRHAMTNDGIQALDQQIASNIRIARRQSGISRRELGNALGEATSVVHKYEHGMVRVPASTLVAIDDACSIPFNSFLVEQFGGCDEKLHYSTNIFSQASS